MKNKFDKEFDKDWFDEVVEGAESFDDLLDNISFKVCDIIAQMAVEHVMNRIRTEEPYLIYTQQERL